MDISTEINSGGGASGTYNTSSNGMSLSPSLSGGAGAGLNSPRPGISNGLSSPPTSPTKKLSVPSAVSIDKLSGSSMAVTPIPGSLRPRASSTYVEDLLNEYVTLKCREKVTRKDIDDATMESLRQLPLFQAIQVVHRFNDSVGPRVVNRQAFLVSIIRSTQRWWSTTNDQQEAGKGSNRLLVEDGPNTALVVQLCMNGTLNPDVFTPSVCHALQLLTPEQVLQVAQGFGSNSLALHVANDSYYAKQQLFLSMAHAALMNFPPPNPARNEIFQSIEDVVVPQPEATANEAAELGRKRADASAAAQLPGILSEFIARTCATSNGKIKESDLDVTARDALKRVALLQAMQAMQHFSVSISDQIQKKSAYLMGILRGQEQHWERSRASKNGTGGGGAKELLNLHPRLLLKIAHLCLDGNCLPSDFSPEVCFELKDLDCDTAIKAVIAFNNNKRICAGEAGGIHNRVGFFHGLLRNIKQSSTPTTATVITSSTSSAFTSVLAFSDLAELNVNAKPFMPSSIFQPQPPIETTTTTQASVAGPTKIASTNNSSSSSSVSTTTTTTPGGNELLNPSARTYSPLNMPATSSAASTTVTTASLVVGDPQQTTTTTTNNAFVPPSCIVTLSSSSPSGQQHKTATPGVVVGTPGALTASTFTTPSAVTAAVAAAAVQTGPTGSNTQPPPMTATEKELARLLESSRDAIAFLTSALARSRTSEIRLRRELEESQAQVHSLMSAMHAQKEAQLLQIDIVRAQLLMNVSRGFDSLSQWTVASTEAATRTTSSPAISSSVPNQQQQQVPSTPSPSLSSSAMGHSGAPGGSMTMMPSSAIAAGSSNSPLALSSASGNQSAAPTLGTPVVLSALSSSSSSNAGMSQVMTPTAGSGPPGLQGL